MPLLILTAIPCWVNRNILEKIPNTSRLEPRTISASGDRSNHLVVILLIILQNSSLKSKDACERLEDEISKLQARLGEEERRAKSLQTQLSRALETQEEGSRKDVEQSQSLAIMVR